MWCVGLFVMWCGASQPAPIPDTYCQIAKPIYWAASDTRATKEQVDTHNRVWKRLCRKNKP
ncbi:MAG: hypothetical protein EPO23_03180 [Xanthobacteraceae bacterium]|nr:MAG: hypothetical protein EPO23_03180 [Xanthobacteraceae bacterium]